MLRIWYLSCLWLALLVSHKSAAVDLLDIFALPELTGDKYVFVGDDLMLTCSLSEDQMEDFSALNISFGFFDPTKEGESTVKCLLSSNIKLLNEEQAMLVVHNVTTSDAGQYNCYAGDSYCLQTENIFIGMSEDVAVEFRPQNVTNFTCVVTNWNELMRCTWQHPVEYVNWPNINVTSGYTVVSPKPVEAFRCPSQSHTECEFPSGTFHLWENIVMEVNVTNIPKNITASRIFKVKTHEIVKPNPVEQLTAVTDSSMPGCLILSWKHSKIEWGKVYRIQHKTDGEDTFQTLVDNVFNTNYNSCGYLPYTHHIFSVECYPIEYLGHWSDPVFIDGWTTMEAPSVGPSTTNGSYTTTKCTSRLRNVTVMWQEIEAAARNGIIDGYIIKDGSRVLKNVTSDMHRATLQLPCSSATVLTMFGRNKGGMSVEPTILLIPPYSVHVPQSIRDSFSAEILGERDPVKVLWNVDTDADVMNYTIFWCSSLPGQTCQGQTSWSVLPGTQTEYYISISSTEARNQKYLFGISVTYRQPEMASEIFWTSCLFTRHPSTVKPTEWLDARPEVESVRIVWSPVKCSYENQAKVTHYIIKYCLEQGCNDTNSIKSIEVPVTESSYTLSSLTANVKIKLTVQPVSNETFGPEYSPWKEALPQAPDSSMDGWLPALIVIGLLVILGVSVFCYRRCKNGQTKIQYLTQKKMVNFENQRQHMPLEPSHNSSPVASSADRMLTAGDIAVECETRSHKISATQERETTDQEDVSSTSGETAFDDRHNNSRTRLIKSPAQNGCGKGSLKCNPIYVPAPSGASPIHVHENEVDNSFTKQIEMRSWTSNSDESKKCSNSDMNDNQAENGCDLRRQEASATSSRQTLANYHRLNIPNWQPQKLLAVEAEHYTRVTDQSQSGTLEDQVEKKLPTTQNKISLGPTLIIFHSEREGKQNLAKKDCVGDVATADQEGLGMAMETCTDDDNLEIAIAVGPTAFSVLGFQAASGEIETTLLKTSSDPHNPNISFNDFSNIDHLTSPSEGAQNPTSPPSEGAQNSTSPSEGAQNSTSPPSEGAQNSTSPSEGAQNSTSPSEGAQNSTSPPSEGAQNSTSPSEGAQNSTSPSEGAQNSTSPPSEGAQNSTSPSEGAQNSTSPSEGAQNSTSPSEGAQNSTSPPSEGAQNSTSPPSEGAQNYISNSEGIQNSTSSSGDASICYIAHDMFP